MLLGLQIYYCSGEREIDLLRIQRQDILENFLANLGDNYHLKKRNHEHGVLHNHILLAGSSNY